MAHKSEDILQKEIDKARKLVGVGGLYCHYKHPEKYYLVEAIVIIEETEEIGVAYRALYGSGFLWIRPLKNFLEKVDVGGKKVPRFRTCPSP
jgi:hypothetical protein